MMLATAYASRRGTKLAEVQRVVCGEILQTSPHVLIQGVIGGIHVDPARRPSNAWDDLRTNNGPPCQYWQVATVVMPAFIGALSPNERVSRMSVMLVILINVSHGTDLELERPKPASDPYLLGGRQVLPWKYQESILMPRGEDEIVNVFVASPQIDPADAGTKRRADWLNDWSRRQPTGHQPQGPVPTTTPRAVVFRTTGADHLSSMCSD